MKLRQRLGRRYALISIVCLLLLTGLAYHEFLVEPWLLGDAGSLLHFQRYSWLELVAHLSVPAVLIIGWWIMSSTLREVEHFAQHVERVHTGNLHEQIPCSGSDDEIDRLGQVFNEMAQRLSASIKFMHEFTLNASHELKTPLTIMAAQVETMLTDRPDLPEAHQDSLRSLLDEVRRMARIVDSLTLLTKVDAGLMPIVRQPVNLEELLQESFDDASVLADHADIQVKLLHSEPLTVLGDRDRLRQVLLNLVDNAVKYNEDHGRITLSLQRQDNNAQVLIANTGPGIAPEVLPQMFHRFVRGNDALQRGIEGCGLGLAICRRIAQVHQGSLTLVSTPNGWTTAQLLLPLAS